MKKVAAIHDMSGFGRCSLTVAIPVISAMGAQCCPIPTAYLSTHTGGFTGYTLKDLTSEIVPVSDHWASLGLTFDAVYSGFLASADQIGMVRDFINRFRTASSIAMVDPVMGDKGVPYSIYTEEMCSGMTVLAEAADIITPNFTEAAILLGEKYEDAPKDREGVEKWLLRLSGDGKRSVVLTGIESGNDKIGASCLDIGTGEINHILSDRVCGEFHGTGDLFSSVLLGSMLRGNSLRYACRDAVEFVRDCAELARSENGPSREGVPFEALLKKLV